MITTKTISITAILALLATGCATSEPTYTSNGKKGHSIDCSGDLGTWGECYEEAGEICGARGYRVLEKMTDKESNIFAGKDVLSGSSSNTRNLIIQCK